MNKALNDSKKITNQETNQDTEMCIIKLIK